MKRRILNERLAGIVATIRHGEMLFIGDAGSGTCSKALYPLDPSVEYLDLEVCPGCPSFEDLIRTIVEVGDFEAAIVTEDMPIQNPKDFAVVQDLFPADKIFQVNYAPEYYQLRDRCNAMIRTGDYGVHAQAIIVAGYPSADIKLEVLTGKEKFETIPLKEREKLGITGYGKPKDNGVPYVLKK